MVRERNRRAVSTTSIRPTPATLSAAFRLHRQRMPTAAVRAASAAFAGWKKTPISTRAKILNRAADHLEANVDRFAAELTREHGQGAQSEQGRSAALGTDVAILCRRGPVVRGRDLPQRRCRHDRLYAARAAGRGFRDHAMEFSGVDPGTKDRAGADHRTTPSYSSRRRMRRSAAIGSPKPLLRQACRRAF